MVATSTMTKLNHKSTPVSITAAYRRPLGQRQEQQQQQPVSLYARFVCFVRWFVSRPSVRASVRLPVLSCLFRSLVCFLCFRVFFFFLCVLCLFFVCACVSVRPSARLPNCLAVCFVCLFAYCHVLVIYLLRLCVFCGASLFQDPARCRPDKGNFCRLRGADTFAGHRSQGFVHHQSRGSFGAGEISKTKSGLRAVIIQELYFQKLQEFRFCFREMF